MCTERSHEDWFDTRGGAEANSIGLCRGGPTMKGNLVVDALGLPVALEVTSSNRYDCLKAPAAFGKELYRASNLLKQARRFAIRYGKTSRNGGAAHAIGWAMLWLRI